MSFGAPPAAATSGPGDNRAVTTTTLTGPEWPVTTLGLVVTVLSLLLALVTGVLAAMGRTLPSWVIGLVAILEVALVALTVQCVIAWAGGTAPADPIVFLSYLVVVLAAGPATVWWGAGEPGRWGTGVVAVAGLVIPVLLVRLQQVWTGQA